jgi:hypothetical protein
MPTDAPWWGAALDAVMEPGSYDRRPAMRRRKPISTPTHTAGLTGPTSHRLGQSRGLDWWIRPAHPLIDIGSGKTSGRHRRLNRTTARDPAHGLWTRLGLVAAPTMETRSCAVAG